MNHPIYDSVASVLNEALPDGETIPMLRRACVNTPEVEGLWHANTSSSTDNGTAISPTEAIRCMEYTRRTSVLIRAVHHAIREMLGRTRERPLQVLDVGSGPYATLTLPVLTQFPKGEVELTCVDMHKQCCDQVMLTAFALGQNLVRAHHGDFTKCTAIGDRKYHVGVCETMGAALLYEPQVANTDAAAEHMRPDGIWIPEEVAVQACLIYERNVPWLEKNLGRVATLTISSARQLLTDGIHAWLPIPEGTHFPFLYEPRLCISTCIKAYDRHVLGSGESNITHPWKPDTIRISENPKAVSIRYRGGDNHRKVAVEWHENLVGNMQ